MDNKKDKTLLSFILGVIFATLIYPVIDELSLVFLSWIEYLKILPSKLVLKGNKELSELQEDEIIEDDTCAIGFHYTPQDEEIEYDDNDEDW